MRMSKTLEFDGVWSLQLSLECPFRAVFDIRSSIVNLKHMLVDVRDGPIPTSTERSMRDVQRNLVVVDAELIDCVVHSLHLH